YFKDEDYKLPIGTPAMATGGMGDTLAGMITSFVGQFDDTKEAVTSATYTHSYIGEELSNKMYVVPPSHLISEIPYAMKHWKVKSTSVIKIFKTKIKCI